ncbi:hypothetical protein ACLOJK_001988 [Asimina triloba]
MLFVGGTGDVLGTCGPRGEPEPHHRKLTLRSQVIRLGRVLWESELRDGRGSDNASAAKDK